MKRVIWPIGLVNSGLELTQHKYDITKSPNFTKCMADFKLACLELKNMGKGYVKNYEEIEDDGKQNTFQSINSYFK